MENATNSECVVGKDMSDGAEVSLAKTYPPQLALWQTYLPGDSQVDEYSNTIELYDAIPKYFASKKQMASMRIEGKFLNELHRDFVHRGERYTLTIRPARVQERDGSFREYYPSWREELVEEALKKIACYQVNGVYLNETAGVQFTLYMLRKELARTDHAIHFYDLVQSLHILHSAQIIVRHDGAKRSFVSAPLFPVLAIANEEEWLANPKRTRCYVQFHPLVTKSIAALT